MQPKNPIIGLCQQASFLTSAARVEQCPVDEGYEVAFAGRSNAGKSSALNTLCAQKALARASKRPGRTQLLNVFTLDEHKRLVDLPGYGYAEVPMEMRKNWGAMMDVYFSQRLSLKLTVLMMDIRHPMRPFDAMLIEACIKRDLPVHILLTKADKLSRGAASSELQKIRNKLPSSVTVQLFSSLNKQGLDEARTFLRDVMEKHSDVDSASAPDGEPIES